SGGPARGRFRSTLADWKNWKTFRLSPSFPPSFPEFTPSLPRVYPGFTEPRVYGALSHWALAHVGERHHFAGRWRDDGRRHFRLRPVHRRLRSRSWNLGTLQDHAHQLLVHPPLRADPLHDLLAQIAALVETDSVHLLRLLGQGSLADIFPIARFAVFVPHQG